MDIGDIQQQNAQLFTSMGKCLQHLRMLKSIVLNAHNVLACNNLEENASEQPQTFEKIKESIDKYAQQMNNEYEKLETEAKMLPSQTPNSLMVNKLNNFLLDCAINPQMKETYSNTRNVFSWSESTGNFIDFAYHLFKIGNIQPLTQQRNRKLTLAHKWNVQNEQQNATQIQQMRADPSNQQSKFMDYFFDFMRQNRPIKIADLPYECKIVHNVLERSILHSVIELKYFAVPKSRTADGQMVCLQKFLLFINNGIIEYVHFMAPHEDWKYEQFPGIGNRKQIDLSVSSRFELYQKLTIYGNMLCQNIVTMLGNNVNNVASPKFMSIVFGQFAKCIIIDQTCLRCRKKLRDFSTVTAFDHHSKAHAACK